MISQEEFEELLDKHLKGALTKKEEHDFNQALSTNIDYQLVAKERALLVEIIQAHRADELKQFIKENAPKTAKSLFWPNVILLSSAALLAISIGIYFLMEYTTTNFESPQEIEIGDLTIKPKSGPLSLKRDDISKDLEKEEHPVVGIYDSMNSNESVFSKELDQTPVSNDVSSGEKPMNAPEIETLTLIDDVLILDSIFQIGSIASTDFENEEDKFTRTELSENKQVETKKRLEKNAPITNQSKTTGGTSNILKESLKVEFWESPIHYKGYKYNGRKLILYGVPTNAKLIVAYFESHLILKWNIQYFKLERNEVFNPFESLDDEEIQNLNIKH